MTEQFSLLLAELDKFGWDKNQFAITSSGPMAIRQIREARDLDVIVTDLLWEKLAQQYTISDKPLGPVMEISEMVQAIGNFKDGTGVRPNQTQIDEADVIGGYRFVKLDDVILFKRAIGREKDFKDIQLIEEYLKNHSTI